MGTVDEQGLQVKKPYADIIDVQAGERLRDRFD